METQSIEIKGKKRVRYWDVAKGITIILVILGHVDIIPPTLRAIIFSYHMPFFFIANAYFIKKYEIINNIKRSAKSLLVPYGIICFLSAVFYTTINKDTGQTWMIFLKKLVEMMIGMSKKSTLFQQFESVWLVWFVICLFVARIIYIFLMKYISKTNLVVQIVVVLAISGIGYYLGKYIAFLPWSVDVALVAMPFMWFGDYLHKSKLLEKRLFILIVLCAFVIWSVALQKGIFIEMATRSYQYAIVSIVEAIAGCLVVIAIAMCVDKVRGVNKFLAWSGNHSMVILAVHLFELRFFPWNLVLEKMPFHINWILIFILKMILIYAVTWCFVEIKEFVKWLNKSDSLNLSTPI